MRLAVVHSVSAEIEPTPCETTTRPARPPLRPYVVGYASFSSGPGRPPRRRVLPLGLTTLIIDFTGTGRVVTGPRATTVIYEEVGWRHGVSVGLTPAGVRALLGMPTRELTGAITDLGDVLGPRAGRLAERLAEAPDWPARFALLDETFTAWLNPTPQGLVPRAWWRLQESAGRLTIGGLADELAVSRRHLELGFQKEIGLPPKTIARIARFQDAVRALSSPAATLASAVACGYADQPHLGREIRAMTGMTPGQLFAFVQDGIRHAG
ncbi:helix-turn-helix domain-containing protein [Actinomadura rugatobispora]|uniref:Helix-turn-helix domain-containing protein n=1 Tax=Actinomadura rugatobispora TaxID=1994 RepID=A0ABW1AEZ0_9ACTN|nr:AraC family transcriptional regulator [Actinomadura rugatobispora]